MERWDAEDIAAGSPLSGPDQLVQRIEGAIAEAHEAGQEDAYDEGHDEGCVKALADLAAALNAELDIEVRLDLTDDLKVSINKVIEEVKKSHAEQFNRGVDTLAAELDTERATKVAETVWKIENT